MSDLDTTTLTPVGEPAPAPGSTPGLRGARPAAAAFLAMIAVPLVAYVLGVRAPATENRAQTPTPSLGAVARLDETALARLSDHLTETLPGRQAAVRVDAMVDRYVFGQSPNTDVLLGEDGWLFLAKSVDVPCRTDAEVRFLRAELERAHDLVARTGRDLRVIVPPNKATVYPEQLGRSTRVAECGFALSDAYRDQLEQDPPAGYLPLWDRIDALRRRVADHPIYLPTDTHWTTEGSVEMVERIVESFDPSLLDGVEAVSGRSLPYVGDLARLIGLPDEEVEELLDLRRPGVDWELKRPSGVDWLPAATPEMEASVLQATGGDVVPGRTVMVHDSFAYLSRAQMAPFFADLVMIRRHPIAVTWVGEIVSRADHVVLEVVERSLWQAVVEDGLVSSLAVALREDLPSDEVPVSADDDGRFTLDADGADVLTVDHIGEAPSKAPYALEVEVADGEWLQVDRRPEVRTEAPLTFDLRRYATGGVHRFRIIDGGGDALHPTTVTLIATS